MGLAKSVREDTSSAHSTQEDRFFFLIQRLEQEEEEEGETEEEEVEELPTSICHIIYSKRSDLFWDVAIHSVSLLLISIPHFHPPSRFCLLDLAGHRWGGSYRNKYAIQELHTYQHSHKSFRLQSHKEKKKRKEKETVHTTKGLRRSTMENNTSGETQGYKSLFHSLPATLVFRRAPRTLNMQSLRSAVSSRRKLLSQSTVTGLKSAREDVEVG